MPFGVDELVEGVDGEGAGEEVALAAVARLAPDVVELAGVLDAFGERLDAESLAELDEGVDDGAGLGVSGDVTHERPVDLQRIDGELAQVAEAGIARAEVVDRDAHAQCLEGVQMPRAGFGVAHEYRLGDLEGERVWAQAAVGERGLD